MSIILRRVCRSFTKRGSRMIHGRVESPFCVKLVDNPFTYRVYEDWTQVEDNRLDIKPADRKPVPLVVIVKGEKHTLTNEQVEQIKLALADEWWVDIA